MTHKGYIFIADITGYTAYLSKTELTHAQEILESLMNTLVEHIHPPVVISRIEGDGVFAYTFEDCFLQGQTLLETLEHLYSAFAFELEHMKRNTTCTCMACQLMPDLDLKIIAHYGEFAVQSIGDRTDIVGTDVNLTHRLAKNSIQEKTGVAAYALFTEASIEAMHLKDFAERAMLPHTESYDHVGEIDGYVYDLLPVWERERERRRVLLSPEEAGLEENFNLPVSPPIAWDYLNDPNVRAIYMNADKIGRTKVDGRMMVGSQFHCAHGDNEIDLLIQDWQPFEYFTYDSAFNITKKLKASMRFSVILEERSDGTNVRFRVSKPSSPNRLAHILSQLFWIAMKNQFSKGTDYTQEVLLQAIEEKANPEMPRIKIVAPVEAIA
jgi:hypothetical protein